MRTLIAAIGVILLIICVDDIIRSIDQLEAENAELKELIVERNHIDSLYYEHLSNCSYISSDEVEVGHNGYLYSKYHRKYALK
jgi:hypothetical protein